MSAAPTSAMPPVPERPGAGRAGGVPPLFVNGRLPEDGAASPGVGR